MTARYEHMRCCSDDTLRRFLAGESEHDEEQRVDGHLNSCVSCRQRVEQLTEDLVGQLPRCDLSSRSPEVVASDVPATWKPTLYELAPAGNVCDWDSDTKANPASDPPEPSDAGPLAPGIDTETTSRLGRFELLRRLGAGGFGVVYLAHDTLLQRRVALKLPHAAALANAVVRERLLQEARAVANLHHPNIATLYDAGEAEGTFYLASAFCDGPTLSQWSRQQSRPLAVHVAARIALALADAVAHAHSLGILHRDIKPGNVLLDWQGGTRDLPFSPQLTDFGLALSVAKSPQPNHDPSVGWGTPRYMAPEQSSGRADLVGPPTDVYALGVVLFELLAGKPPIDGKTTDEILRNTVEQRPSRLTQIAPHVPLDLEAICVKCLEKAPERRYAQANDLAEDLRSFLADRPTSARPLDLGEKFSRWMAHHPASAALLLMLVIFVATVIVGLSAHNLRLRNVNRELDAALEQTRDAQAAVQRQERQALELLYAADIQLGARAWLERDPSQMAEVLIRQRDADRDRQRRGFEWDYLWQFARNPYDSLAPHAGGAYVVESSPDGQWLATAGQDAVVHLYVPGATQPAHSWPTGQTEVNGIAFSPDGRVLATTGDDGTVRLWDLTPAAVSLGHTFHPADTKLYSVAFTDGGRQLVVCGDDPIIRVLDASSGAALGQLLGHEAPINAIALSADGRWLASASNDDTARIWDMATRQLVLSLPHPRRVLGVAFSPDGKSLATGCLDSWVRIWDLPTGERREEFAHLDPIQSLVFAPAGDKLVAGDRGGSIRIWDLRGVSATPGRAGLARAWRGHIGRVYALGFDNGGKSVLSAGEDGQVLRWTPAMPAPFRRLDALGPTRNAAFVGDSLLVVADNPDGVSLLDWPREQAPQRVISWSDPSSWEVCVSPDGRWVAVGHREGDVEVWDLRSRTRTCAWSTPHGSDVFELSFAGPDMKVGVLSSQRQHLLRVLAGTKGRVLREIPTLRAEFMAISSDGEWLAMDRLRDVEVWDLRSGVLHHILRGQRGAIKALAFSADQRLLAVASDDRTVRVWQLSSGRLLQVFAGHRSSVRAVAFATDGRTLASGASDGSVKLWHLPTGQELLELPRFEHGIERLEFAADGRHLLCQPREEPPVIFFAPAE